MKITVITVCLNSVNTIEKAIKSVVGQDYVDKEYIIVDGGSTDGTLNIIKKYKQYITKWISEPDRGIFDAMNKGIEMASGDIIAFLNSDDWYADRALYMVGEAFEKTSCDCVCCDNYVAGKDGKEIYFDASNVKEDDVYIRMPYYHSSVFTRKEFFETKSNFDLQYKIAADYDWFLRKVKGGMKIFYLHEPIFTFCYGGISSVNEIDCAREARTVAIRHLPENKAKCFQDINDRYYGIVADASDHQYICKRVKKIIKNENDVVIWGAGERGRQCLGWLQKAGIQVEAIVDRDENRWGEIINGMTIMSPEYLCNKMCNVIITPAKYTEEIEKELSLFQGVFTCVPLIELI